MTLVACQDDPSRDMGVAPAALRTVEAQMEAFNRHDPPALAAGVTEDFLWLAVDGDSVVVQATGPVELEEAMRAYFESVPTVRAHVEASLVSGSLVAVRENVSWVASNGEERSQVALGIYEVHDGLIRRVWYHPARR